MSDPGAYPDEMRIFRTPSERDAERVLSGQATTDQPELTRFLADVRAAYAEPPAGPTEAAHLAAMARAGVASTDGLVAGSEALVSAPRPRRLRTSPRGRLALLGAGVALAVPLTTAGLAFAGVSLPGVARAPFEQVGIELPNQASSDDVQSVIESTPPDQRGCAFGQAVAAAASGRSGPASDPCAHRGDHGAGSDNEPAAAGAAHASAGRSFGAQTAETAQQSASEGGQSFGQATSQGAQQLGQQQAASGEQTGEQNSAAGQAIGEQNSGTGQATGEQHASAGQSGAHGP
jgi:hypothetical protein